MGRILFAWELGDNYGHLVPCLRVAHALRERGHAVAFAVRDTRAAAEVLSPAGFAFVQAPLPAKKNRHIRSPVNFSEILLSEGYAEYQSLLGLFLAWRSLIQLAAPSVIVTEYAPTALLAARSLAKRSIVMSNGFCAPPCQSPLPSIRPWESIPAQRLVRADQMVNEMILRVMTTVGVRDNLRLEDLHRNPMLCTFPELDPYGKRSSEDYIGPILSLPGAQTMAWPNSAKRKVLAYLRPEVAGLAELLQALSASDADVYCVIPGLSSEQVKRVSTPQLRIFTTPLALDALLKSADVFVSYGGSNAICQALLAGVPLLLVPRFVEQYLNARRAEAESVAIVLTQARALADFAQALDALFNEASYRTKARQFAASMSNFRPAQAIERAVARIDATIERSVHIDEPLTAAG